MLKCIHMCRITSIAVPHYLTISYHSYLTISLLSHYYLTTISFELNKCSPVSVCVKLCVLDVLLRLVLVRLLASLYQSFVRWSRVF
jgi:hypothetical protein